MYFLLVGMVGLVLKFFAIDPVATLSWWVVLLPFGLAAVWWALADHFGYTKKIEMRKMDQRKQDRINKQRKAMRMHPAKRK